MKLTFRQIEAFQHVCATGSVTDAAAMLGVSQPAVSRLLADFEAQVGFRLFARAGRNLNPTPEARMLLDTVRRAFGGLDRIREVAETIRDFQTVPLRLVTTSSFAAKLLPDLVAAFARRRPEARIALDVQSTDDAVEWLTLEAYDLGFACTASTNPRLSHRPILSGKAVCLVPATHRLAKAHAVTVADLDGESLIAYRADSQFRHQVDTLLTMHDVRPVIRFEARTTEAMIRLVERGIGCALVGTARAEDYTLTGCKALPFTPEMPFTLNMIWASSRVPTAIAADFRAMIEEMTTQGDLT